VNYLILLPPGADAKVYRDVAVDEPTVTTAEQLAAAADFLAAAKKVGLDWDLKSVLERVSHPRDRTQLVPESPSLPVEPDETFDCVCGKTYTRRSEFEQHRAECGLARGLRSSTPGWALAKSEQGMDRF